MSCIFNSLLFSVLVFFCFFFNDTATTEIYTLSLHDALPIFIGKSLQQVKGVGQYENGEAASRRPIQQEFQDLLMRERSEEHTSELQSQSNLVCRLLLDIKKPRSRH